MINLPPHTKASAGDQFTAAASSASFRLNNLKIITLSGLFFLVAVGMFSFFFKGGSEEIANNFENVNETPATSSPQFGLPGANLPNHDAGTSSDMNPLSIKAEKMLYGDFYKPRQLADIKQLKTYELPLNIKKSAENFYEFSRKINLDQVAENLGSNGFAVIENPFPSDKDNFFPIYQELISREIPVILTSDFLFYYYQNSLKDVFKEIESAIFYRELWNICKEFYDIALDRHNQRLKNHSGSADLILEGERMEASYFAVALELLKPRKGQINFNSETGSSLFSQTEADFYQFEIPDFLRDDVSVEVANIINPVGTKKSPIMLYDRDYAGFKVPNEYLQNAKLNNFYLSLAWLNTVFPLMNQHDQCPECLLDHDDWSRSMVGASFIVNDFSQNQDLKNRWAKIYKTVAYFKGLRQDLSYLDFDETFVRIFGADYHMEKIWDQDKIDNTLEIISKNILEKRFSKLEGSFDRDQVSDRPKLGMRILQDSYWPNEFLFSQLIYPNVGYFTANSENFNSKLLLTGCSEKRRFYRCKSFGLDIVNVYHPITGANDYFRLNSLYENYEENISSLRQLLDEFSINTWHNNIFWSSMDINRQTLNSKFQAGPPYIRAEVWHDRKISGALGSWLNIQLEADELQHAWRQPSTLNTSRAQAQNPFVEPDIVLVNEIQANIAMVLDALTKIEVLQKIDPAYGQLLELNEEYLKFVKIIEKELTGRALEDDEVELISTVITKYSQVKKGSKEIKVSFSASGKSISKSLVFSLDKAKLLIALNDFGGRKILGAGPIFNYQETEK